MNKYLVEGYKKSLKMAYSDRHELENDIYDFEFEYEGWEDLENTFPEYKSLKNHLEEVEDYIEALRQAINGNETAMAEYEKRFDNRMSNMIGM